MWRCASRGRKCEECSQLTQQLAEARASLVLQNNVQGSHEDNRDRHMESMGRRLRRPAETILDVCDGLVRDGTLSEDVCNHVSYIAQMASQMLMGIRTSGATFGSTRICTENVAFDLTETLNLAIDTVFQKFRGKVIDFPKMIDDTIPVTLGGDVGGLKQCLSYILETLLGMASHSDRVTISAIRTNRRPLQEGARDRYVSCLCSFRLGSADNDEMVDVNDANEPSDLIYGHLAMQLGGRILRSKTYRAFDLLLKFRKTLSIEKDPKVPTEQIARKYLVYEGNAILLKTFEHVLTSRGDVVDTMKDLNDLVQLASSVDLRKVYECFIVDDNEVGGANGGGGASHRGHFGDGAPARPSLGAPL
jgi:hypothetical protein